MSRHHRQIDSRRPAPISRREALRRLALGAASAWAFPAIVRARDGGPSANSRINLAFVGVGGKGLGRSAMEVAGELVEQDQQRERAVRGRRGSSPPAAAPRRR